MQNKNNIFLRHTYENQKSYNGRNPLNTRDLVEIDGRQFAFPLVKNKFFFFKIIYIYKWIARVINLYNQIDCVVCFLNFIHVRASIIIKLDYLWELTTLNSNFLTYLTCSCTLSSSTFHMLWNFFFFFLFVFSYLDD